MYERRNVRWSKMTYGRKFPREELSMGWNVRGVSHGMQGITCKGQKIKGAKRTRAYVHEVKCPTAKASEGEMPLGQNIPGQNVRCSKTYMRSKVSQGRIVHWPKCPWDVNMLWTKYERDKVYIGLRPWGEISYSGRQNVAKCLWGTICLERNVHGAQISLGTIDQPS